MHVRDVLDIILLLVIFAGVLALTYFTTKKMAMMNKKMNFNKNMQIIEVIQLAQGQYLYIVKVGEDYHLLAGAKESVNYCAKLNRDELHLEPREEKNFHDYLKYFTKDNQVEKDEKK